MIILVILAYGVLGFFALFLLFLLAVLLFPVSGHSQVRIQDEQFHWTWRVSVLFDTFGLTGGWGSAPRWIVAGRERRPKSKPQKSSPAEVTEAPAVEAHTAKEKPAKSDMKRPKRSRHRRLPTKLLWAYRSAFLRCLKRLFLALHLQIKGEFTLGLEDPARVGMLCGGYWVLLGNQSQQFSVRWNYVENVCEGQVTIQAHTRLVEILWVVIRLAWELPLIQIWRTIRKG